MTNIAVILAGGTGSRMGDGMPKQFRMLDGKPVIAYSLQAFDDAPDIDEIAVVTHPQWREHTLSLLAAGTWHKVGSVLDGGSERYLSTYSALQAFGDRDDDTNLILHDAARPWISSAIIARVTEALRHHDAVAVGIPSTDTIWQLASPSESSPYIAHIPERSRIWRAQTPQAFRLPLLREAYRRAMQQSAIPVTDDCGMVLRHLPDTRIFAVEGEEGNRKITFPEDLPCPTAVPNSICG